LFNLWPAWFVGHSETMFELHGVIRSCLTERPRLRSQLQNDQSPRGELSAALRSGSVVFWLNAKLVVDGVMQSLFGSQDSARWSG
jgi:hypothetical protein